ncbi:hypothetical protein F0L68_36730 [Solihabitans fulvus]|uniref:Uncharacterized protein n=1 Tax=Solihabitans fulvus TaxID=1892852 RepID=A0A5B2WL44_9PSEU|nr:gephyrin-like molybdotransferase receptor GlpR [Solihabitans fulvus]KAA2252105.1 hypothetical protein F0L68_36730 [Solihabitans fulvus]
MPSSLIVVALVVAWLVVLVPMVARRRQEVARTADSALAARVVRSGDASGTVEEEFAMPDAGEPDTELTAADRRADPVDDRFDAEDEFSEEELDERPFRPGRGGFDPETAALVARAKYAFRQRMVLLMLLAAIGSALAAGLVMPMLWWAHAATDVLLVGYLVYLRRQVRIEEDIRDRRQARLAGARRRQSAGQAHHYSEVEHEPAPEPVVAPRGAVAPAPQPRPGTVVVDLDDEDPVFVELEGTAERPYRRAVGE